jgi:hypothetical protein
MMPPAAGALPRTPPGNLLKKVPWTLQNFLCAFGRCVRAREDVPVARRKGSGSVMRCPEGAAPDAHGHRRAARREPFGTVANAAGGRG